MEKARTQTSIVTTRLTQDVVEELKVAAANEKRTLSNYLSLLLEDHVEYLREKAAIKNSKQPKAA